MSRSIIVSSRSRLGLKFKRLSLGEMWEGLGLGLKNKCLVLVLDLKVSFTTLHQSTEELLTLYPQPVYQVLYQPAKFEAEQTQTDRPDTDRRRTDRQTDRQTNNPL